MNIRENFLNWYYPFFKRVIETDKEAIFVSINYDGLIDIALEQLIDEKVIGGFTYGYETCAQKGPDIESKDGDVLLLKPHGSINLMECPECRKVFKYFYNNDETPEPPEGYKGCKDCNKRLDVLMLEQGSHYFDKENPYYRVINERLSDKISAADNILIIGYSLPDYDIDILQAFLKGATGNKDRERLNVEIIDSQAPKEEQEMKSKYEAIFNWSVKYYGRGFKEYASAYIANKNPK